MRPIPETVEASRELARYGDDDVLGHLNRAAAQVREVVPDCLGLSLSMVRDGLSFTMVATDEEVAVLDALQYLTGGPCVAAVEAGHGFATSSEDLLDEERWQLFARGTAARAVRSTLTLPIVEDSRVVGTVNLYGGSSRAFDGHHEELAGIFGAAADLAVTNADLGFRTRRSAEDAPARLRQSEVVDRATGILSAKAGLDVATAHERLLEAADRAGVPAYEVAEAIIELQSD